MKKNIGGISLLLFIFSLSFMLFGNFSYVKAQTQCDTTPCTGGPWQYRSLTIYIDSNCYVDVSYKIRKCPGGGPCEVYIEKAVVNQFGSNGPGGVNCSSISSMTLDDILIDLEMSIIAKVTWLYPCTTTNGNTFLVKKPMCWKQGWVYCEDEEQWQINPCEDAPCCETAYRIDRTTTPPTVTEIMEPYHEPYNCDEESGCFDVCQ